MMGLTETLVFYLVVGISVAVAVWMESENRDASERAFRSLTAIPFWPLYLPILLTPGPAGEQQGAGQPASPSDELSQRIAEVERELDAALSSLDGWAVEALAHERGRIGELRAAWNWQAKRIREMDDVLAGCPLPEEPDDEPPHGSGPLHESELSLRRNLARLREVRAQSREDLTATLARVRELVSLIHLAKFTGAPASRADELVLEIAASVEGLSEVAGWREEAAGNGTAAPPRRSRFAGVERVAEEPADVKVRQEIRA